jgi:hypothetical protein
MNDTAHKNDLMRSWIGLMMRRRKTVIALVLLFTAGLLSQMGHFQVIISSDSMLPLSNHYAQVGTEIEKTFGNKYSVVVGITAKSGTIYQTPILEKVQRITDRLTNAPGVIKSNITGLSARKVKGITGNSEEMVVRPLMERAPRNESEITALKAAVASDPVYEDLLVSKDQKTTQIVAEFKDMPGGMRDIARGVRAAVDPEKDASVDISIGGLVIWLSLLEQYSDRMALLLPLAILIVGLIHYEAFRTFQALALPLVTAILAVVWALAFLAVTRTPMDVFNASTSILILAIAAGHAVQILKRYYEEFARLKSAAPDGDPKQLSQQAVLNALTKVGPVMIAACTVAALGFFSLTVFEIKSVRVFGILTGIGVLSALFLELTFIPALRSALPPPSAKEYERERERTTWDRLVETIYFWVSEHRGRVNAVAVAALLLLSFGGYLLRLDDSPRAYFFGDSEIRQDDDKLNSRMAGTNTFYVLVDGNTDDAIKDPRILEAMDEVQEKLTEDPMVGKTVSIVNFIKRMNQAMNADKKEFYRIPKTQDLVAQYLLLYSTSGEPSDFDSYVDSGYRKAAIQAFYKSDSSTELESLVQRTQTYADAVFPHGVRVRLGAGRISGLAIDEEMVRGKVLNILQILACVFIVSSLIFRSLLAGALILVPLVATVFANFGIMGLVGIPLNIPTSLTSAMAVGVGADYAIYLSYRLREELKSHLPEAAAVRRAFLSAGKATVFVTTAVAAGFGVLMFSWGFLMHFWMGFLIALAMLVSSTATLTVFASLILTIRPQFIFGRQKKEAPCDAELSKV